jgi:N-methylhydantoinase A/oxoprolinase/acetone carboxylase beta subunit
MQFQGQSHILPVAIDSTAITVAELRSLFAAAYWKRFGVELPEIRPVLVNLHTAVIGKRKAVSLKAIAAANPAVSLAEARRTTRPVWFSGGWYDTPVYVREVVKRMAGKAANGAILCLHDGRELRVKPDIGATVETVRRLVPMLLDQGYTFETVTRLICPTN